MMKISGFIVGCIVFLSPSLADAGAIQLVGPGSPQPPQRRIERIEKAPAPKEKKEEAKQSTDADLYNLRNEASTGKAE